MRARPLLRIMSAIQEYPWAISEEGMATIQAILDRAMTGAEVDLEAVAARLGKPLENTGGRVEMRGSIAVLDVEGPLFRRADLFADISGATTVQNMATDLRKAADNALISHIVLNIDSPGGQVNGIQEFADQVREVSAIKPVLAYVDGMAASGAYWIASAASRIVLNESSLVGSIGVVASIRDNRGAQERQGIKQYEIVSSQSPYKRPDVSTEAGRAQILQVVDALADVFIGRVAAFRGVSAEDVLARFGQGRILPAAQAMAAGMADEIASFEPLLTRLAAEKAARPIGISSAAAAAASLSKEAPMADSQRNDPPAAPPPAAPAAQTPNPAPSAAPAAPAAAAAAAAAPAAGTVAADRQRIAAILNCEEAQGRETLARTLALETDHDIDTARKLMKAAPAPAAAAPPKTNPLEAEMARLKNPAVGVGGDDKDTPAAEADRVLRFVSKARRIQAS
jgi:signal peptide peptidase SppA